MYNDGKNLGGRELFKLILASSVLLGYVINLSVWQDVIVVVLVMAAYGTGRAYKNRESCDSLQNN